mgnify:CR=1 FL=1|tara:strand:- start:420 stop:1025 length:606 start_codon:yes stop_codon:yes gene_type:complete
MKNKLRLIFLSLVIVFSFTNIILADDELTLAEFVISKYDLNEVPKVGSDKSENIIVEFFDYRCGYCSKQAYDFAKLIELNSNVQIIFLEFPIFGGISETASRIAMRVWKQNPDLYFQIHNEFMKLGAKMKKNDLIKLLNKNGFDGEIMYSQAESGDKNIIIESNSIIARNLGIRGTPASIVNDTLFPGYVQLPTLQEIINQ